MNIVIYGDEKLLMENKLEELKKKYNCSYDDMNYMIYDLADSTINQVLEDALTQPFLSEYKMVVLRNPLFLTATKQKNVTDSDIEAFIKYLNNDNPLTIFIIFQENKMDERKKVVKVLREKAKFFEINKLGERQLYQVVRESVLKKDCIIDDDALNLLLSRLGDNLYDITKQVDKLCIYSKHIKYDDVDRLVAKPIEEDVFTLTNAILKHDLSRTMEIYQDLMITNHEPIALIGLIASSLRNIYQVKYLSRKGYNDREIAKMAGLNPRAIYPIRKNGESFNLDELLESLNALSILDVKIKTGKIDKQKGLELFLMNMR